MDQDALTRQHLDEDDGRNSGNSRGIQSFMARRLIEARTVLIAKQVDRQLMERVTSQLLVLSNEDNSKPITVYVNSPGGDADSGFAIYDVMKFVKAPVHTICAGLAASAAIIIFVGGDKGHRYTLPNSRFLIHQPSTYAQGQASDLEITAREILKIRTRYNQIVAAETGAAMKQLEKDANRDFWLNADEAKSYGLADRIVREQGEIG